MRIAYIAAGAGGMICGSCLHDNALAGALMRRGHDVTLIPTYTPLRTDGENHAQRRVFYGALNVYLEQKVGLFRHTPRFVDRLLNRPGLLRWVSKLGASTDPSGLGELTLSVLQGEEGRQRKELDALVAWLRDDLKPDVVHITNSMLIGIARRIRAEVGCPVFCAVQGEDIFLDALQEPYKTRVHAALVERAGDVDGLIATSAYYRDHMANYLRVDPARIHHVPMGLQLDGHGSEPPLADGSPFVIGFLARQCPEKGLHLLVQAFRDLAEAVGDDAVRLKIAGWLGPRDVPYVERLKRQLADWGLDGRVAFLGEITREQKLEFLRSIHVLSVPTIYREPKGLFLLEALANGVPLVQPAHGAFPELLTATGGGLLVEPDSADALAEGLQTLLEDPQRRRSLGEAGKQVVHARYSDEREADATLALYEEALHA